MVRHTTVKRTTKYYTPDAQLVHHMRRRLHLANKLQKISGTGQEVSEELEHEKGALSTDKIRILDKIFQAMADITFFFGMIDTRPDIQRIFQDDIKEILGVKRDNPRNMPYGFMFDILVSGMLLVQFPTGKDFRLRLNEQLQRRIWNKMTLYLRDIFESNTSQNMVTQDFNRVFGWTEMLMFAMEKKDEYRVPDVVTVSGSNGRPTRLEKKLIDEGEKKYLQDIKRNSPKRTFDLESISDMLKIH